MRAHENTLHVLLKKKAGKTTPLNAVTCTERQNFALCAHLSAILALTLIFYRYIANKANFRARAHMHTREQRAKLRKHAQYFRLIDAKQKAPGPLTVAYTTEPSAFYNCFSDQPIM